MFSNLNLGIYTSQYQCYKFSCNFYLLLCRMFYLFSPKAGYSALMLAAAHNVDVGGHQTTLHHVIERGGVNSTAEKVQYNVIHVAFSCTHYMYTHA